MEQDALQVRKILYLRKKRRSSFLFPLIILRQSKLKGKMPNVSCALMVPSSSFSSIEILKFYGKESSPC